MRWRPLASFEWITRLVCGYRPLLNSQDSNNICLSSLKPCMFLMSGSCVKDFVNFVSIGETFLYLQMSLHLTLSVMLLTLQHGSDKKKLTKIAFVSVGLLGTGLSRTTFSPQPKWEMDWLENWPLSHKVAIIPFLPLPSWPFSKWNNFQRHSCQLKAQVPSAKIHIARLNLQKSTFSALSSFWVICGFSNTQLPTAY